MQLIEKFLADGSKRLKGVIHLGAEWCQEASFYARCHADFVLWVEAWEGNIRIAQEECNKWPGQKLFHKAIWSEDNLELEFYKYNAQAANSLFKPNMMNMWYPGHHVQYRTTVQTITVDTLLEREKITPQSVNFLGMDVQGAELHALRGAEKLLWSDSLEWICTEVCTEPLYKDGATFKEIEKFLRMFDFRLELIERHDRTYPEVAAKIERGELADIPQHDTLWVRM